MEAILAAVQQEAESAVSLIDEEISREGEDSLGTRALVSRKKRAQSIRAKVAYYEKLFSTELPALQQRLEDLDVEIAGAILMLEDPDDNL
jgi:hypothetical protein